MGLLQLNLKLELAWGELGNNLFDRLLANFINTVEVMLSLSISIKKFLPISYQNDLCSCKMLGTVKSMFDLS